MHLRRGQFAAFNAENEIHAEERAASKPFQADLTVLENEGRPLWKRRLERLPRGEGEAVPVNRIEPLDCPP
jgi:hypothetical protein